MSNKPEPRTLQEMREDTVQTPGRDWVTIGLLAFGLATLVGIVLGVLLWFV
jgi:hypothetical protein